MPRLGPLPFENTLIVEPFRELKEKLAGPRVPVPLHSIPLTIDVPPEDAAELSTVRTHVLSFAVTLVVPVKTMPFSV